MSKPHFSALVKKHTGLLYYFTRKLISDQEATDDIVSETFVKAYKSYAKADFENEKSIKSWLLTICHNTIRNHFRNYKNTLIVSDEELENIPDTKVESTLDSIIKAEEVATIQKKIATLSDQEQQLIHLRIYEELSFGAIASIFNTSEAGIKMRFYRTVHKIKEAVL